MADSHTGKTIEIDLINEVVTIELDDLEPDSSNIISLLLDGECKEWVWTKLAGEYWRRGYLDEAEKIAAAGVEKLDSGSSSPIYAFLANMALARARQAPKLILPHARQDKFSTEQTKEAYHNTATQHINAILRALTLSGGDGGALTYLTRGVHFLALRNMDEALRAFDSVLSLKPTNLIALLGKARIFYARRQFPQALKLLQEVLRLDPNCQPDPRVGIGLCLWAMDHKQKAKAAWQRSLEVNPKEWSAQLLLGIDALNASKDEKLEESERTDAYRAGSKLIESAFKANQKSSAAANALCEIFLRQNKFGRVLKLAERTIQFADTLTLLTDGYIKAGRVCHSENSLMEATRHFSDASKGSPLNVLAGIGLAQMQMKNDEMAAAIHTLDSLMQPNSPRSVEATAMLASLRANPRPGVSTSDLAKEKSTARELFERVMKTLELPEDLQRRRVPSADGSITTIKLNRSARTIAEDVDMHTEIAKLWQGENLEVMTLAVKEALRINEASSTGGADPRLMNNLGALKHLDGQWAESRQIYELALTRTASSGFGEGEVGEGVSTTILYNLARVYEDQGETEMAREAYEKLLSRHPEYVDAKIRQAEMLAGLSRSNEAHDLLKQALSSQQTNLNVRAIYTRFLIQSNLPKAAKDFVFATLKDHDKYDTYSLCAAGWIQYHQARENRDTSSKGIEERRKGFQRSAEFYDKALSLDPLCAFAAQGLAIVIAEDALGTLGGGLAVGGVLASDETLKRFNNARDALDVFAKVRESINDGSVYANMGHCYYARDEFDRAIESYETASNRFYNGKNVPVLLCLCRSHYAKANKDQSFAEMNTALKYAQNALHLNPQDKAVLYNIAMIMQKAAEMMFALPPAKRQVKDLQRAIGQGSQAQKLFASLASATSTMLPYSRELADQRRKYGDNMLKKAEEHLNGQRVFEAEKAERLEQARSKRQEEKERQEAAERDKMELLRLQAEKLAVARRESRLQAQEWTRDIKMESDDEKERKPKKPRKVKTEGVSGDEGEQQPPKKKRRGKLKKNAESGDDKDGALFTDEEGIDEKPAKKRASKKRVVRDDDEGEHVSAPRKKQYKSKDYISDSDEEMT